ncbi:reverse transcriptase domain-containing protein [Tanacetum coccineum]
MTGVPRHIAEHRLNVREGCSPIRQKKRGQALERNKALQEEVEKLVDAGIMKEVHYHNWLSNLVMVKKHDGSWRMCVDFKDLNKACPQDGYPLPEIDWKVESLCGYPFKCFLDAYKGYHQIKMAKEDEEKRAFITNQGIFCYSKMSFGLKKCWSDLSAFGRQGIPKADRAQPRGRAKAEWETSKFKQEAEAAFKQMKKLIAELPMLTAPKEMEELIIYLAAAKEAISAVLMTKREGKQIPVYFVSRALRGTEINYNPMEKLVLALLSASRRLKRYFQAHAIIVITDQPIKQLLSNSKISGRMLKWKFELEGYDIQYRPRASIKGQIFSLNFIESIKEARSRVQDLTSGEINLPQIRKQAVRNTNVIAPGPSRNCPKHVSHQSPREKVGSNDMVHNYYLEKAKKSAQLQKDKEVNEKPSMIDPTRLHNTANGCKPKPRNWQASMSSRVSNKDVHLGEHRKQKPFLKFNDLQCPTCKKCLYSANHDECVLEYLSKLNPRASAQIKDAKSHNTTKRYVPVEKTSESKKPERLIPKGHRFSHKKTTTVPEKTRTPRSCLRWQPTGRILKTVCLRYGKVKFLIVAIDYFTKLIEAKPVATITGNQVKKFVWDNIVCRFSLPGEIVSDNGKQFYENPFKDWCEKLSIQIKARLDERSKDWMGELSHVLWAHRTMIKSSNGETPFSLTYSTEAVIPAEIGMPTLQTAKIDLIKNDEALEINLDLIEEKREQAAIQEAKSKAKMEKYYNSKVHGTSYKPGDMVYRNNDASHAKDGGKLGPKWEGSYKVT